MYRTHRVVMLEFLKYWMSSRMIALIYGVFCLLCFDSNVASGDEARERASAIYDCLDSGIKRTLLLVDGERVTGTAKADEFRPESVPNHYKSIRVSESFPLSIIEQFPEPDRLLFRDFSIESKCSELESYFLEACRVQYSIEATPGSRPINSDSRVIRCLNGIINDPHVAGHSDITRNMVLKSNRLSLKMNVIELLEFASQSPDLYRWSFESYHAHTVSSGFTSPNSSDISRSQALFIQLAVKMFLQFADEVESENPNYARAFFILGSTLHLFQDLAYHRGMTMAEHSGLSFHRRANPDAPTDPREAEDRYNEAMKLTDIVMSTAHSFIGSKARDRIEKWSGLEGIYFSKIAEEFYLTKQDLTKSNLLNYWLLSREFRNGKRSEADLDQAEQGRWNIESVWRKWQNEIVAVLRDRGDSKGKLRDRRTSRAAARK